MSLVLVESHVTRDLAAEISRVARDCCDATTSDDEVVDGAGGRSSTTWSDTDDDDARSTSPLSDDKDPVLWTTVGRPSSDVRDPPELGVEVDAAQDAAADDGDELVVLGVGLNCLARYLAPSGGDGSQHVASPDTDLRRRRIVNGWSPWLPRHRCGCVCTTARRVFLAGSQTTAGSATDDGRPERGRMSVRSVDYLTTTSVAACVARQSAMMKQLMSQNYGGQRLADEVTSKHDSCAMLQTYPDVSSINATGRGHDDVPARSEFPKGQKTSSSSICYLPCLLYTSPSPRDRTRSRMPSSA